jgi:asparagine synthase (glutamine-hydrolysing)
MSAMQHYGRDGARTWQSGAVALGHQMTHVTLNRLKSLPFEDKERQLVITSDARLDNRSELCTLLGIPATELPDYPDSRLILAAYLKWGEDCPKYLLGDFAFAVLDIRRQQIYCARDVMGVRPLYIYSNSEYFCFQRCL